MWVVNILAGVWGDVAGVWPWRPDHLPQTVATPCGWLDHLVYHLVYLQQQKPFPQNTHCTTACNVPYITHCTTACSVPYITHCTTACSVPYITHCTTACSVTIHHTLHHTSHTALLVTFYTDTWQPRSCLVAVNTHLTCALVTLTPAGMRR